MSYFRGINILISINKADKINIDIEDDIVKISIESKPKRRNDVDDYIKEHMHVKRAKKSKPIKEPEYAPITPDDLLDEFDKRMSEMRDDY